MLSKVWDKITYPFPNFKDCGVDVCEWMSNFISHFMIDVITHPCQDFSENVLIKGLPVTICIWTVAWSRYIAYVYVKQHLSWHANWLESARLLRITLGHTGTKPRYNFKYGQFYPCISYQWIFKSCRVGNKHFGEDSNGRTKAADLLSSYVHGIYRF